MKNLHPAEEATWLLYCAYLQVYWNSGAKHRGGYAYRLCKVNNGKYWHVTEECFQRGHLKFHGDTSDKISAFIEKYYGHFTRKHPMDLLAAK